MMKEHLVYMTAEDVDDLIDAVYDLNARLYTLRDEITDGKDDKDLLETMKRSYTRLLSKRRELLRALRSALEVME